MMKRERDIRKPKTGYKLYVVRCGECGNKSLVELRRQRKTIKKACSKCLTTNRHKIIGKIKKIYQRHNMMRIKYFSDLAKFPTIPEINTTKIEIAKMSIFEILLHGESSYYNSLKDVIGLRYHNWLNSDDAMKILIDDVNHETEHQILFQLINVDACRGLDAIIELLRSHLLIGFKDIKDFNRLEQLFAQTNAESRE